MTHTSDKLREEFRNKFPALIGKDVVFGGLSGQHEQIEDWWISRLETTLKDRESELAEKVRKMLEGSEMQPHLLGGATKFVKKGRREAYETVLRLLHTDTNSENK